MVKLSHEFFEKNKTSLKEKPELTSKLHNKHSKKLEEVRPINLEEPVSEAPVVAQDEIPFVTHQMSEPKKLSSVEQLKAKLAKLNNQVPEVPEATVDVPDVTEVPEVTVDATEYTPEGSLDITDVTEVPADLSEVIGYTPEVSLDVPEVTDVTEVVDVRESPVETSVDSALSIREFNPTEPFSETTPELMDTRKIQFVDDDGNPITFVDADGNPVTMVKQTLTTEEQELLATAKEDVEANPVVPNILPSKKSIKNKRTKKGVLMGVLACVAVLLIGGVTYAITHNKQEAKTEVTAKSSTSSLSTENLSYTEQLEQKLKTIAEKTGIKEHKVEIQDVGGGYLLGTTTYYPDDEEKRYTDYTLTKPEKKVETASNETVTKIEEALKASLPTINETIKIKDGVNLKMETYQTGDTYVTILLSDETPFAYVTSDAELNMVNHVTTYYVSDIAAS